MSSTIFSIRTPDTKRSITAATTAAAKTTKPTAPPPVAPVLAQPVPEDGPARLRRVLLELADQVPYAKGQGREFSKLKQTEAPTDAPLSKVRGGEPRVHPDILKGIRSFEGESTVAKETNGASLTAAIGRWADTPHIDAWLAPFGRAFAQYALHRYALGDELGQTGGKIGHAAGVTWCSRSIQIDCNQRMKDAGKGPLLEDAWNRRLEFAALAHDVGYMHGGRFHPSKGAADMLSNLREWMANRAGMPTNDAEQQTEIEKIAICAQMHGLSFPWDAVDSRLPGTTYISPDVVEAIVARDPDKLRELFRKEYSEYLAEPTPEGFPEKLAWLDDPKEFSQLVRAGWVLHNADKFVGPKHTQFDTVSLKAAVESGPLVGAIGSDVPFTSEAQLDNHARADQLTSQITSLRRSGLVKTELRALAEASMFGAIDTSDLEAVKKSLAEAKPDAAAVKEGPAWSSKISSLATIVTAAENVLYAVDVRDTGNAQIIEALDAQRVRVEAKLEQVRPELPKAVAQLVDSITLPLIRALSADAELVAQAPEPKEEP